MQLGRNVEDEASINGKEGHRPTGGQLCFDEGQDIESGDVRSVLKDRIAEQNYTGPLGHLLFQRR